MKICLNPTVFLLLSLCLTVKSQDDQYLEKVMAELEIANLELQDGCETLANIQKPSLISNTFSERIKAREAHGKLLNTLSENLRPLEDDVPPEFLRNWTLLVKPGDSLLTEQDWSTLVTYDVTNDELIHSATVHCKNDTKACVYVKKGYENLLERTRNETSLKRSWYAWQTLISAKKNQYPSVLDLVGKAAGLNGRENAQSYWEMLTDQDEAYAIADTLWDQIRPFYFKLQNFVKGRLFRFYNITTNDTEIPVYLLGSNFGDDWSKIANIILPHPLLYNLAESYLNKTNIKDVYKVAEKLTQQMSLGTLGENFWANSFFNMSFCENQILSFCVEGHSELFTCDKVSWASYLEAFEVSMDIALRNMDYLGFARSDLRYSAIDEAIKGMGSVLAVKNLRYRGVWEDYLFEGNDTKTHEMTQLLLIALRVFPKLPYYLGADKYRLHLLEEGFEKFEETWWKYRKEYQGVVGVFGNETDFLADGHMTSNKPYLSKFLGTILQFQLLENFENLQDWQSLDQNIATNMANDENFLKMLQERDTMDWPSVVGNYYSVYDLSAESILNYFEPLNDYFASAPEDQVLMTTTPKPSTTTGAQNFGAREDQHESKSLNPEIFKRAGNDSEDEAPPPPIHHEHVEENLEGPNPTMENISMYIGIGLLVGVVVIVVLVIVSKKMAKKRRRNNRRFET